MGTGGWNNFNYKRKPYKALNGCLGIKIKLLCIAKSEFKIY